MMEIITQEVQTSDLEKMVNKLISDTIGKDIEKACQSLYMLCDIFIRKVKMLKKFKFKLGKLMELMVKLVVLEKLLGMRQVLKLNESVNMSHQSKNLFKTCTFNDDKRSYLW